MSWENRAACRDPDVNPDWFFPRSPKDPEAKLAKAVCARCPVRWECAGAGSRERYGIWGGVDEKERRDE